MTPPQWKEVDTTYVRVEFHAYSISLKSPCKFIAALVTGLVIPVVPATAAETDGGSAGFRTLQVFEGERGTLPLSGLTAAAGKLFGSASHGGREGGGVLFTLLPESGALHGLHHFNGIDGRTPMEGLLVKDRAVYGATKSGGPRGHGVLYRLDRITGSYEVLHTFAAEAGNGFYPHSSPVRGGETLYGTTFHGGAGRWDGALYAFDLRAMEFRLLYSLTAETGRHPLGRLLPLGDWLYGLASDYGHHDAGHYGTLFRARPDGSAFEVLHRFEGGRRGSTPFGSLTHDGGDLLFGSTFGNVGDALDLGVVFSYNLATGEYRVLHAFTGEDDAGGKPDSPPLFDPARNRLFGTAQGTDNNAPGIAGILYSLRTDGTDFQILHTFSGGIAGGTPVGTPALVGNTLFGVAAHGGVEAFGRTRSASGRGIIYRFGLGETVVSTTKTRLD